LFVFCELENSKKALHLIAGQSGGDAQLARSYITNCRQGSRSSAAKCF
jgi:hypothetical protein